LTEPPVVFAGVQAPHTKMSIIIIIINPDYYALRQADMNNVADVGRLTAGESVSAGCQESSDGSDDNSGCPKYAAALGETDTTNG